MDAASGEKRRRLNGAAAAPNTKNKKKQEARSPWETTDESKGIALDGPTQLLAPGGAAAKNIAIKEVKSDANGFAFSTMTSLLEIQERGTKSKGHLALVLAGQKKKLLVRRGFADAATFEMTIVIKDPLCEEPELRPVTVVNIGAANVKKAESQPTSKAEVVCKEVVDVMFEAHFKFMSGYQTTVDRLSKHVSAMTSIVSEMVEAAGATMAPEVSLYPPRLRYDNDEVCGAFMKVRILQQDKRAILFCSGKNGIVNHEMRDEPDSEYAVQWLPNKSMTEIQEFTKQISTTTCVVANRTTIGVRCLAADIKQVRLTCCKSDPRYNDINISVVPSRYYEVTGFQIGTCSSSVISVLHQSEWLCVPTRRVERNGLCCWVVGAPTSPPVKKIVTKNGIILLIKDAPEDGKTAKKDNAKRPHSESPKDKREKNNDRAKRSASVQPPPASPKQEDASSTSSTWPSLSSGSSLSALEQKFLAMTERVGKLEARQTVFTDKLNEINTKMDNSTAAILAVLAEMRNDMKK